MLQALDADLDRVINLTVSQLRVIGAANGVRLESPRAAAIIDAAHRSLRLPEPERQARLESSAVTPTGCMSCPPSWRPLITSPAGGLTSLPGVAVRAGDYAAAGSRTGACLITVGPAEGTTSPLDTTCGPAPLAPPAHDESRLTLHCPLTRASAAPGQ